MKKLNFGCGNDYRKGYINMDVNPNIKKADVIHDFNTFPYPFKDGTFDEIICNHTLMLVEDLIKVMNEFHRICKNGAIIKVFDVYYNCKGVHNDPNIKRSFNSTTFDFVHKDFETGFYTAKNFRIIKKKLIPTRLGLLFPGFIREKVSLVLGEIIRNVYFEIRVLK